MYPCEELREESDMFVVCVHEMSKICLKGDETGSTGCCCGGGGMELGVEGGGEGSEGGC